MIQEAKLIAQRDAWVNATTMRRGAEKPNVTFIREYARYEGADMTIAELKLQGDIEALRAEIEQVDRILQYTPR